MGYKSCKLMSILHGEGAAAANLMCYGSDEAVFPRSCATKTPLRPLLPEFMDSLPALWGMKKRELTQELATYGINAHPSWTVPELREMIKEQREARAPEVKNIKGLSRMTLQDLKGEAVKSNMMLPEKATRGVLMKMLRDQANAPDDTICPRAGPTSRSRRSTWTGLWKKRPAAATQARTWCGWPIGGARTRTRRPPGPSREVSQRKTRRSRLR